MCMVKNPRVQRTRASGQWTEARYWQFIRTALRQATQRWPPRILAKRRVRRPYHGPNTRQKWEYQCCKCRRWYSDKQTQLDHIEECGTLKSLQDIAEFVRKLFCEEDGFQVVCLECHSNKTHRRVAKKRQKRKAWYIPFRQ